MTRAALCGGSRGQRRGALLPAVLAVMTLIGLAASAGLYMSRLERSASAATVLQTSVGSGADEAELTALASMGTLASHLSLGRDLVQQIPVTNAGVVASARLTRVGLSTFTLAVDARVDDAAGRVARRRSSLMLRLRPAGLAFPAALVVPEGGAVPDGIASGDDHVPPGWPCEPDSGAGSAVSHPFATTSDSGALAGLRDRASIRLPPNGFVGAPAPVVRNGECDTAHPSNWGDAGRTTPCDGWLPVIHAPGDLTVVGGSGQGMLIVDGDLRVSGGFTFTGAVIAAGAIEIGYGGASFVGGVKAAGIVDAGGATEGTPSMRRSSCAVRAALIAGGTLGRAGDRPWAAER